ncbi:MAG: hypothetical protein HYS15_01575 [Candidatus Spechtbacteria bacterium]|nr:hypothetical protein [Candidatus Spechtbacteria bacterium]
MLFRIALLIGKGSRVPAIVSCVSKMSGAEIVIIVSSMGEGVGTKTAQDHGIEASVLRRGDFKRTPEGLEKFSEAVADMLRKQKVDLIVMAGWRIIMPKSFVEEFEFQIINIHPSILPAYPGKGEEAISRQWQEKAEPCGCTLHFIDEGMDTGPIILQGFVERGDCATFQEFEEAIHRKEEEVLCEGIKLIVAQRNSQD